MSSIRSLLCLSLAASAFVNAAEILQASNTDDAIPNTYIVVMKEDVSDESFKEHKDWVAEMHRTNSTRQEMGFSGDFRYTYDFGGMKGYNGKFDETAIRQIADKPDVAYIESDTVIRISALVEQTNAPSWGLGRISHKESGNPNYVYDDSTGQGVTAYDVDTGVDIDHPDFEGRARWGSNHIDNDDTDGNGHGTHVGGTIAGKTFGVAKKAEIVAVKVLNAQGRGTVSSIVSGIEWSVKDAQSNGNIAKSTMNMSLGGGQSSALNQAAAAAVEAGMFLAVAAGNAGEDAGNSSPASEPSVCTVGATGENDAATSWSNFGSVVDIFAPGDNIVSAAPGGGRKTLSGTSMASPHVCGLAAYFMALDGVSGGSVCDHIKKSAVHVVKQPGPDTTDGLAYNNSGR